MTIEAAQYISDLNASYPRATDLLREGDDHIRMVKNTLQRTFPNVKGAVRLTSDAMNNLSDMMQVSQSGLRFTKGLYLNDLLDVSGPVTVRNTITAGQIELIAKNPFIDFHLNSDGGDYTHRIIADDGGSLHIVPGISTPAIAVEHNIDAGGNISGGGLIANQNARVNGSLQTGSINNLGSMTTHGLDNGGSNMSNVNILYAQAVQTAQWVHASGEVTGASLTTGGAVSGGYIHSTGDIRADSSIIAENGSVFSGGVGGASMAHDGNINGSKWGGYLDNFLSRNYISSSDGGRIHGVHIGVNENRSTLDMLADVTSWYFKPDNGSDIKLKENIKPVDSKVGYDNINKIPLVSFKYKDIEYNDTTVKGKTYQVGFIAQEMEKIIPESIEDNPDYKTVDQLPLITNLIAAVQYLSKEVEELKAKLEA